MKENQILDDLDDFLFNNSSRVVFGNNKPKPTPPIIRFLIVVFITIFTLIALALYVAFLSIFVSADFPLLLDTIIVLSGFVFLIPFIKIVILEGGGNPTYYEMDEQSFYIMKEEITKITIPFDSIESIILHQSWEGGKWKIEMKFMNPIKFGISPFNKKKYRIGSFSKRPKYFEELKMRIAKNKLRKI